MLLQLLLITSIVVMHISRTERPVGTPPYKPASAVILAELGKLLVSILLAYRECKRAIKQERERILSIFTSDTTGALFDAAAESSGASAFKIERRAATGSAEEEKQSLLPSTEFAASSVPMSKRTSSQSSWSSSATDSGKNSLNGAALHHRTSSSEEGEDELLREYPGSPSDRLRSDFQSEKITPGEVLRRMKEDTFGPDWLKLAIPAFLFTGQSNLSYFASSNLSVPVFQITYQLKVRFSD